MSTSPRQTLHTGPIILQRFTTPLGAMFACATSQGLCLLEFVSRRAVESEFRDLQRLLVCPIVPGENTHTRQTVAEMSEYFSGARQQFSVPLHLPGSDFQQAVWRGLLEIPYGATSTYKAQSEMLGRPLAIRAIAAANGQNRVSIVVPCHRVIGSDGTLVGYGGGLERKRWLLEHEARHGLAPQSHGQFQLPF